MGYSNPLTQEGLVSNRTIFVSKFLDTQGNLEVTKDLTWQIVAIKQAAKKS